MGSFFFFFFWIGMRGSVFFIKCEVSFGYLEEMTNEEWKVQTNLVCARGMGVFFLERSLYLLRTSVRSYKEIY